MILWVVVVCGPRQRESHPASPMLSVAMGPWKAPFRILPSEKIVVSRLDIVRVTAKPGPWTGPAVVMPASTAFSSYEW